MSIIRRLSSEHIAGIIHCFLWSVISAKKGAKRKAPFGITQRALLR